MASIYPTGIDSFTRRAQGETIQSSHVNELQEAVENIETRLGTGTVIGSVTSMLLFAEDPGHTHTLDSIATIYEGDVARQTPILGRLAENETVTGAWTYSDMLTITYGAGYNGLLLSDSDLSVASGKIGIGTTTPSQKLSIDGGMMRINGSTLSNSPSGGSGLFIGASDTSGVIEGRIQTRSVSAGSALTFHTNEAGGSSDERMRITPEGWVGIGCTPLSAKFQFSATAGIRRRTVIWRYDTDELDLLFTFQKGTASKSSSVGIESGTRISRIISEGWAGGADPEDYKVGAEIRSVAVPASSNWTNADRGTCFEFWTCGTGSSSLIKRASITANGSLLLGSDRVDTESLHQLDISGATIRIGASYTPASKTATGQAGTVCWDSNYIYVCVATNTWKRAALSNTGW